MFAQTTRKRFLLNTKMLRTFVKSVRERSILAVRITKFGSLRMLQFNHIINEGTAFALQMPGPSCGSDGHVEVAVPSPVGRRET